MVKSDIKASNPCQGKVGGVYAHLPFCYRKCLYCDFYVIKDKDHDDYLINQYMKALNIELDTVIKNYGVEFSPTTIYLGGGSPSILDACQIKNFIKAINQRMKVSKNCEITIECNPADLTYEKAVEYKAMGINRISMGVQSGNQKMLKILGRKQSQVQVMNALKILENISLENISLDFIYGIPGQEESDIKEDILLIRSFPIKHVSFYSLTYGKSGGLCNRVKKGSIKPMKEDDERRLYHYLYEQLTSLGYEQYEISNYAFKGFESKHNSHYWHYNDYLGLGASASSFLTTKNNKVGSRYRTVPNVNKYIRWGESCFDGDRENLFKDIHQFDKRDLKEAVLEFVFTALRTRKGLDLIKINTFFEIDFLANQKFEDWVIKGYLSFENQRIMIAHKGSYISDHLSLVVFDCFNLR